MVLFVTLTVVFAGIAVLAYRQQGWNWVSIGMTFSAVIIGLGSILESFILRIELADDALIVTDWRGRRRYAREEIERVEEPKASPAAIRLRSGAWVKLPSVGSSVGNSIRAWLKH